MNKNLIEHLNSLHENREHEKIIQIIEELPKSELNYKLKNLLGRAYNNVSKYDKALEILLPESTKGNEDALWNYRIGYAYYCKDEEEKALSYFQKSDELGDTDAKRFVEICFNDIKHKNSPKEETQQINTNNSNVTTVEKFQFPYFGEINLAELQEYYETETVINENSVKIDLNFEHSKIDTQLAIKIKAFLESITIFDKQNSTFINDDFNSEDGEVKEFVNFHIEELGDELLNELNISSDSTNKESQFLSKMKLVRVGLYPDGKYDSENFGVFDYTVNRDLTDQIIVVNTDENGTFDHISWES